MSSNVPESLQKVLSDVKRPAMAFSGGADSTYVLYACGELGLDVIPYFVKGAFQTEREMRRATELASSLGFDLSVIHFDVMSRDEILENTEERCYLCKKMIMNLISEEAKEDGRKVIFDGTNASDDIGERPGMRVLGELGIRSPLKEAGLSKQDIRELSKKAGLPTWDMPSDSCLATRIPHGTAITRVLLIRTEDAEADIRELGFRDFRVRTIGDGALLETEMEQSDLLDKKRHKVEKTLLKYYDSVSYGIRRSQL